MKAKQIRTDKIRDDHPEIIIEETDNTDIGTLSDSLHTTRAAFRNTPSNRRRTMVSILIFAYNNLNLHTRKCIESILKYTSDIDYELVLLDNGSSDGTFEYFKSIPYQKKKIIRITENKGANYGQFTATRYLTGRYVAMIANDVYVTENWLTNMIKCAESDERIGFCATYSDNISNLQAIDLGYNGLEDMYIKAQKYNVSDPRKWEERLRLMPAIALYKRECLDVIGSLDYAFRHDFSDDDISFRVRRAGYKIICCGDVFVHHEGSSTQGSIEKKMDVLKKSREIFKKKYYGVDAWEDANNYDPLMINLVNPEEKRGALKPDVLGVDVKCGTPILQLKNKLRHADIFDANLSAFVQDPKYWLDLKTICEGTVAVDRIEYLTEHFSSNSFDYIILGNHINAYSDQEKVLSDLILLLKSDGQLFIKLKNTFNMQAFFDAMKKGLGTCNKSLTYADINHLNTILMQHSGYAIISIRQSLYNIDTAIKEVIRNALKHSQYAQNIDTVFTELITEYYALKIMRQTPHEDKPSLDQSALNHDSPLQSALSEPKEESHFLVSRAENTINTSFPLFREGKAIAGMTSIIILTYNSLEHTKKCVKSIRKHTPEPHEIIFVDNGSTDSTVKWLQSHLIVNKNFHLIENKENVGLAKGRNQGINMSQGEFIVFVESDVVVTEGWLHTMLQVLNHSSDVGIVGPMTNNSASIQRITDDSYKSLNYLDKYAKIFKQQFHYRRIPCRSIAGFCMLFKRTLVEKIGLFDERFNTGQFEDEDFCLRAALDGYCNCIAGDVFVHHSGGKESHGNRKTYEEKWALSTGSPEGRKLAVLKARDLANDFHQKGKLNQAIETLINCIKITPDAKEIYYELTRILIETQKYSDAWEVIETMPDAAKYDLKGLECAGYAKEGLGMDDEALVYADKLLSQNQNYPPALNLKGVLVFKKGEKDKAQNYFKKAIDAYPGYGEAYTNLGVLYWGIDKKDEALAHLKKCFILSPNIPEVSSLYYSVVSSLGIFRDAEADFREASKLYPSNKNLAFLYIDILIQLGKFDVAMLRIEDALALFGMDEGILQAALTVREKIGPLQIKKVSSKSTLSLCMIVKNEEKHLVRCLRSVRDIVDEIIVVDTGSTDRTKDIAKVFGAKVLDFPWTGDFSEARNHSLEQATGDWILILDADEIISARDFAELNDLIHQATKSPIAYSIATKNYTRNVGIMGWVRNTGQYPEEAGAGWIISRKVRLFMRRKNIFFANPVHELLEESLKQANIPIFTCNIIVHHYGKLDVERESQKSEEYYLLGKMKHESDPTNAKYINELAKQSQVLDKYEEAIDLWLKLISLIKDNPDSPAYKEISRISFGEPVSEIYIQLASAYLMLDRYEEALEAASKAIKSKTILKEYIYIYAHCAIIVGSLNKALALLEELHETTPDYQPVLFLMAVIFYLESKNEKAQEFIKELLQKRVQITPNLNKIALQLYRHGKRNASLLILDAMIENKLNDEETARLLEIVNYHRPCRWP